MLEELLPEFGSLVLETVAVFRMFVEQKAMLVWSCTVIVRLTDALAFTVPILQETCCPVIVQFGAARIVREEGTVSVMLTFCAAVVVEVFVRVRLYV